MNEYKSILLIKVPHCTHPEADFERKQNFKSKSPFRPEPSLAIAVLHSFFEQYNSNGYELKALDINIEAYSEPDVPIDVSLYPQIVTDCIRDNTYDVLAISAMFIYNARWVDMVVKLSRQYHPDAKIILGGGYPTIFPERTLEDHEIDDAVIGEGEATFLHILNKYNNYKDQVFEEMFPFEGYATRNENGAIEVVARSPKTFLTGDQLPAANWDYFDVKKYLKNSGINYLPCEGSRGCPYVCTYCSTFITWGRKMRLKPPGRLVEEMKEIGRKYGAGVSFVDDNMSVIKSWFKEFLTTVIKENLTQNLYADNFSVKDLDEARLDLMKEAGFKGFGIAVETGSKDMQKLIKKRLKFDQIQEVMDMSKARGFDVHVCWMVGFPTETLDQIKETFAFAKKLGGGSNQFMTTLPYPGTELFGLAKAEDVLLFDEHNLDKFENRQCDYVKSEEWDYRTLQEMIYDINIDLNFLNLSEYKTEEGREGLLKRFEELVLRLEDHVIAHTVIGYLYNQKGEFNKSSLHYNNALKLMEKEDCAETFEKYFFWDHPIINDFKQFTGYTPSVYPETQASLYARTGPKPSLMASDFRLIVNSARSEMSLQA